VAHAARRPRRQAQSAGLLLALACAGCASQGDPPGGPPDTAPPQVMTVRPDSGAVLPELKGDVVIQFDEVIDEMPGSSGGAAGISGLAKLVSLSPVAGDVKVSWHRSAIHLHPNEGWRRGRVYRLELFPGVTDLRHNIMKKGRTVVFSTGPAVPHAAITGTALAWVEQRALTQGLILAALRPDTVPYVTYTDSAGNFKLTGIPPGNYVVYAVFDQNNNRRIDRREAYDSAEVHVDSAATAVLWTFTHDTAGPRLREAAIVDSLAMRLEFNAALDPATPLDTSAVHVFLLPDTTPVPVTGIYAAAAYDSTRARERAVQDSLKRAADTTHRAAVDTTKRAPPVVARPGGRAPGPGGPAGAAPVDTLARHLLRGRPVPTDKIVVRLSVPLKPGSKYLARVRGATNLNGAKADGVTVLAVPVPKPVAKDTTKAPRDTTRVRKDTTP